MPIWVTLLLALAIGGGLWYAKHDYDEARRDEGRAEVIAKWQKAQKTADEAEAKRAADVAAAYKVKEVKRERQFRELAARNVALTNQLAAARVDGVVVEQLRNAVSAANEERDSARTAATSAAPPASGLCIAQWFDRVAEQYRACREQVACLIAYADDKGEPSCGMR